jgi:tetratricopeptide (TPR) repeat protein
MERSTRRASRFLFNIFTRKKTWLPLFLCLALVPAWAQQRADAWWYTLEQGKRSFRDGAYSDALLSFEDARRQRRAMYERMEKDLIELMSLPEARRMDDSLGQVENLASERRYDRAVAALNDLYYRLPKESFKNSAKAALEALGSLKNYPEAEYWIGESYRAEGELELALIQFQKAYDQRELFEKTGFDIELLYKIANIRKVKQEYVKMEQALHLILANDSLWMAESNGGKINEKSFTRTAMSRTMGNEGAGRFLTLYRYDNTQVESAHRLLGLYYYATGRHSLAEDHLMFAFLIQNSVIIKEVIRHEYDFTFDSLENLAPKIARYPLLEEYLEIVDYYKTTYYLGSSLYASGKTVPARSLWSFLATHAPEGEWQNRAIQQLRQPRVERAVEMP